MLGILFFTRTLGHQLSASFANVLVLGATAAYRTLCLALLYFRATSLATIARIIVFSQISCHINPLNGQ
jgi:hypothetical protein